VPRQAGGAAAGPSEPVIVGLYEQGTHEAVNIPECKGAPPAGESWLRKERFQYGQYCTRRRPSFSSVGGKSSCAKGSSDPLKMLAPKV